MFELFITFAKIGLFTIGGGYAMLGLIEDTCVNQKKWLTHEEMMELLVIAESTPGPIAINCATYVGCRQKGVAGSAAATFGMVLPSFIIIYFISVFLDHFLDIQIIASAFHGMKAGVGIVILSAGWNMLKKSPKDLLTRLLTLFGATAILLGAIFAWNISSIVLMLMGGLVSLAVYFGTKEGKNHDPA